MENIKIAWIETKNTEERSLIGYSKVEYCGNHLMFYLGEDLVFKVWLKRENYKDIFEASKSVGIYLPDEKIKRRNNGKKS